MKKVAIHTDGSCWPNPGPGGWAAVLRFDDGTERELRGSCKDQTTNNRMELTAAIEALRVLTEPTEVHIFTDSQYLQNGARSWLKIWERRKWRTGREQVKNQDLWRELQQLKDRHVTHWHWVRSHADNEMNNRCDALAEAARKGV